VALALVDYVALPLVLTHRGSMSVRVCASVCVYGVRYVCEDGGTEDDNDCDERGGVRRGKEGKSICAQLANDAIGGRLDESSRGACTI